MSHDPERCRRAAAEARSDPGTYAVTVRGDHVEWAEWLGEVDEPEGIAHEGGGAVVFTAAAVAYLRELPAGFDGHVDATGQLHLGDVRYPLVRRP